MEDKITEETITEKDEAASESEGTAPDESENPENEAAAAAAEEAVVKEEAEKKGFKKKTKTDKQKERILALEDRVMRQMAEFENFRKRTEKEKSFMFETGARSVIEKMLPVVDNFERGLAAIPEADKDSSFAEGMSMIYKQLMTELENLDVKVIPAVGQEFNPDLHNAVMQMETDEYETGIIAQEMQRGYTYRDSVVRYSMVSVAT